MHIQDYRYIRHYVHECVLKLRFIPNLGAYWNISPTFTIFPQNVLCTSSLSKNLNLEIQKFSVFRVTHFCSDISPFQRLLPRCHFKNIHILSVFVIMVMSSTILDLFRKLQILSCML